MIEHSIEQSHAINQPIRLQIYSETGRLRLVIMQHAPGREIEVMAPSSHEALLFDDTLQLDEAKWEHLMFSQLLEALEATRVPGHICGAEAVGDLGGSHIKVGIGQMGLAPFEIDLINMSADNFVEAVQQEWLKSGVHGISPSTCRRNDRCNGLKA